MEANRTFKYPVFVLKDLDGFFGLFIDNLANIIIIIGVCKGLLHFPDSLIYGRLLPGVALSLLVGNWYYYHQARTLAYKEKRTDVCALPYGLNTPSVFGFLFLIMAPIYAITKDPYIAWQAGVAACFINGIIEVLGSWIGYYVRRVTPRAALLATLAGIAITFIAMTPTIKLFLHPTIGLVTITIIIVGYFGKARMPLGLPVGFLTIAAGTILAWLMGLQDKTALLNSLQGISFNFPQVAIQELIPGLKLLFSGPYIAIIIPLAVTNFLGTMQCLESAEAAGDAYPTKSTMVVDGIGTLVGSFLGSCFPTTVYIGHPGWKEIGARCGYSLLNGVVITAVCLFGIMGFFHSLIPEEAAGAILLYIGLVIMAQAFAVTPKQHFAAVSLGLVPHLAYWGLVGILRPVLGAVNVPITQEVINNLANNSKIYYNGMVVLGGGSLLTSMLWTAIVIQVLEHRFLKAALWTVPTMLLAYFGMIHSEQVTYYSKINAQVAIGYIIMIGFFLVLHSMHKDKKSTYQHNEEIG